MVPKKTALIQSCPRCPDTDDNRKILKHFKKDNGLTTCQTKDHIVDKGVGLAELWPGFHSLAAANLDPSETTAYGMCERDLEQTTDQPLRVETATRLLKAAFAKDTLSGGVPVVKELLEKAVAAMTKPNAFSKGFMETMEKAVVAKAGDEKAAKDAAEGVAGLNVQAGSNDGGDQSSADAAKVMGTDAIGGGSGNSAGNDVGEVDLAIHASRPDSVAANTKVLTNHFEVGLKTEGKLYEYAIQGMQTLNITAPKKKVFMERMIDQSPYLNAHKADIAYDNERKIISLVQLHDGLLVPGTTVDQRHIDDYDPNSAGVVSGQIPLSLDFMREITLGGLEAFVAGKNESYEENGAAAALNMIIARSVRDAQTGAFHVGDNKFFTMKGREDLGGHGMIALHGFSSSLRPGQGSCLLNVNTALSAFYESRLVSQYIAKSRDFAVDHKLRSHLKGLRVRIVHNRCKPGEADRGMDTEKRRTKTITDFSTTFADNTFFTNNKTGNQMSVWQHFQHSYPQAAKGTHGKQFCVNTRGTGADPCWFLPDQLMVVSQQQYTGTLEKLDPTMPGQMLNLACQEPEVNRKTILQVGLPALGLTDPANPPQVLKRAGIAIANEMISVSAKEIKEPKVLYKNASRQDTEPQQVLRPGAWTTKSMYFWTLGTINGPITMLHADDLARPRCEEVYVTGFLKWHKKNGIKIDEPKSKGAPQAIVVKDFATAALAGMLKQGGFEKAGLFVLVLPKQDDANRERHANFHIVADQLLGKPGITLCEERMLGSIKGYNPNWDDGEITDGKLLAYIANNAMKVNVRLGHSNHTVQGHFDRLKDTLILGADLIHPKFSSAEGTPSIGAVVGSVDDHFTKFYGSARRQDKGNEFILGSNMKAMVEEQLKAWKKSHKQAWPKRILYYRDGVGETQYGHIKQHEISAIVSAWQTVTGKKKESPLITTVVVTKRHNTRFFPTATGHKTKTKNCLPGTVVDSKITSPYYFDFYLQSHDPEKGQARPTYYIVIQNQMDFKASELQDLTNALCYTFQHSASAVGYVSPAYYADKLCERAALYLKRFFDNRDDVKDMDAGEARTAMDKDWGRGKNEQGPWSAKFNEVMFWM